MKVGQTFKLINLVDDDRQWYIMKHERIGGKGVVTRAVTFDSGSPVISLQDISESKIVLLNETWPTQGPDFNEWNKNLNHFLYFSCNLRPENWLKDAQLKYVGIQADIRANCFLLKDRDGHKVDPIHFLDTICR